MIYISPEILHLLTLLSVFPRTQDLEGVILSFLVVAFVLVLDEVLEGIGFCTHQLLQRPLFHLILGDSLHC